MYFRRLKMWRATHRFQVVISIDQWLLEFSGRPGLKVGTEEKIGETGEKGKIIRRMRYWREKLGEIKERDRTFDFWASQNIKRKKWKPLLTGISRLIKAKSVFEIE